MIVRMSRLILKAVLVLIALVAITVAALYALARRSLPLVDGTITIAGLSAPVHGSGSKCSRENSGGSSVPW